MDIDPDPTQNASPNIAPEGEEYNSDGTIQDPTRHRRRQRDRANRNPDGNAEIIIVCVSLTIYLAVPSLQR